MHLKERIIARIIEERGLTIADYMRMALGDEEEGYYTTRDPFGGKGDFITAPEISQVFGEMLGIWCAQTWRLSGQPQAMLVEMGPGRGTLMKDMLRATRHVNGFHNSLEVVMVETSPHLTALQQQNLAQSHPRIRWETEMVWPDAPLFFIANELLDALPIHQFEVKNGKFHERLVSLDKTGKELAMDLYRNGDDVLRFGVREFHAKDFEEGAVVEICPEAQNLIQQITEHITQKGGAALFVDYGYVQQGEPWRFGDTLQALENHRYAPVLEEPGKRDITAHVDFSTYREMALAMGAYVPPILPQGWFLEALGGSVRLEQLCAKAPNEALRGSLRSGYARLTGDMGSLFKVMMILPAGVPAVGCEGG